MPFPKKIPKPERDRQLDAKIDRELDAIMQWAVGRLKRVLDQDGFTYDLDPKKTRQLWVEHASSIGRFKALCLDITGQSEHFVPKEKVFSSYKQFCQDEGLAAETQTELTKTLKQDPRIRDTRRTPPGADKQKRCYGGVLLASEQNSAEENGSDTKGNAKIPDDYPF